MLREIPATRQRSDEANRRWFTDDGMDLTVWQAGDGSIQAFQLAYDKHTGEHALEWRWDGGWRHHRVDDGEADPGRYKQTPLLVPDGVVPHERVIALFSQRSQSLEPALRNEILARLRELPG